MPLEERPDAAPAHLDQEQLIAQEQLSAQLRDSEEQLRDSEERFRSLFLQEQRRARHLSLINEAQKCALNTREIGPFLSQVTRAIGSHFPDCDVALYLSRALRLGLWKMQDEEESRRDNWRSDNWNNASGNLANDEMIVVAVNGERELCPPLGTRCAPGELWREETTRSPEARSFLSETIVSEGEVVGLISVQSREVNVLDARDVGAMHTVSAIIGAHIQNSRLFRHMSEINDFNQNLLDSMLHSMMVVDEDGLIQFVNERLLKISGKERNDLRGQPLETIFGETPAYHHNLRGAMRHVLETGQGHELPEVHIWTPDGAQIFDLRMFRVFFRGRAETAILLINLTERWRKTYQLQMMHEMGRLFQESLDIERVLSTVLTCITAGSALGFNRGFVFLLDDSETRIEGRMARGPSSPEEASRIWREISQRELSFDEILDDSGINSGSPTVLQQHTLDLDISLESPCFPALRLAIDRKSAMCVRHSELIALDCQTSDSPVTTRQIEEAERVAALFSAYEVAIAPLIAKDRLIGVIFADNLYSNNPIAPGDIQLLDILAGQAALTIDNALTYRALQGAQRELVTAERLVAVGEMAARVSHEIRNPLATIGGFGHSILKKPADENSVTRKARVIVSEVARLEELLTDLLDMARTRPLKLVPESINEIIEHALLLAEADLRAYNVSVERKLAPELPAICVDRARLLQALLNTIRNGAQAMPDGGTMCVTTSLLAPSDDEGESLQIAVSDSGVGISERALKQVFDPFFSTKVSGSGLGLAVTRRIIQDHGGHIEVNSAEGRGTTFFFVLPLHRANETGDCPPLQAQAKQPDAQDGATNENNAPQESEQAN